MIKEERFVIPEHVESCLEFSFQPVDLLSHWQRCGMTADYIANFYTPIIGQEKANSLSTIINELIENSCKYTVSHKDTVKTKILHYGSTFVSIGKNFIDAKTKKNFGKFINRINSKGPEEFYFETIEFRVEGQKTSRLGFVMLIKDYGVQINYWFTEINPNLFDCEIVAIIDTAQI